MTFLLRNSQFPRKKVLNLQTIKLNEAIEAFVQYIPLR